MKEPPRYRLSEAEKDALLVEQAALIERLVARVAELEALVGKPKKTSANSHIPPSQDGPGGKARQAETKRRRTPRPSRPGASRPLASDPDRTERRLVEACPHCRASLSEVMQRCRHRYDHIDLPEIRPVVTRVELFGGRCRDCGRRYRAEPPALMPPGTPFGPGIRARCWPTSTTAIMSASSACRACSRKCSG
jgi:transposase